MIGVDQKGALHLSVTFSLKKKNLKRKENKRHKESKSVDDRERTMAVTCVLTHIPPTFRSCHSTAKGCFMQHIHSANTLQRKELFKIITYRSLKNRRLLSAGSVSMVAQMKDVLFNDDYCSGRDSLVERHP